MSAMNDLYLKVSKDAGALEKFSKIVAETGADQAAQGKRLVEFAKELGYDITVEEIAEFFEAQAAKSSELDDAELDAVAGGKRPGDPGFSIHPESRTFCG
jgi:predicted ribosomally synthesized peptide with nif11-like leader